MSVCWLGTSTSRTVNHQLAQVRSALLMVPRSLERGQTLWDFPVLRVDHHPKPRSSCGETMTKVLCRAQDVATCRRMLPNIHPPKTCRQLVWRFSFYQSPICPPIFSDSELDHVFLTASFPVRPPPASLPRVEVPKAG
jgi:hypothetical protein